MVYTLAYRRPAHVSSSRLSLSGEEKQRSVNGSISSDSSNLSHGIPDALSFDRIISGGTCPPCTVRDFMNYLKYIEFSAENLQFYLWFRDYAARFDRSPASERALSPEWTREQSDAEAAANTSSNRQSKSISPRVAAVLKDTDFADGKARAATDKADPFNTPDKTPSIDERRDVGSESGASSAADGKTGLGDASHRGVADRAFEEAGMKWKPFTTQPFRDEVDRIISIYLAEGSPRELNLSGRERAAVLHALQNTTHPSAFRPVVSSVECPLRRQAHPNFVRWSIGNGNRPRVVFARGLGIAGILAGLVADLLITLSSAGRAWRVLPLPAWFIGFATLIAAWKGMCVVLHGLHHRHLRPWELFSDDPAEVAAAAAGGGGSGDDNEKAQDPSRDSLISASTNSYEDEPWIARYGRRNVVRKVFDRQVWIREPALRRIQDTIFLQAVLGSLLLSCIFVGIFCAVPKGALF